MKKCVFWALVALFVSGCSMYKGDFLEGESAAYPSNSGMSMSDEPGFGESGNDFETIKENPFVLTSEEPVSSFSVDADGAAYAYMRSCLSFYNGMPEPNSVRIEEYLNYFTFDYPDPTGEETLAINAEVGACPWNPAHKLLRLGLKGKPLADSEIPAANFIFLVDVSGSMSGDDRIDLVKSGLVRLVETMREGDRVAIITYSGSVQKLLESTLVSEGKADIVKAIKQLQASGSTAGGEAMKMAYQEAAGHYITGGNNRIIMCTDGDFNVGVTSTDALVEMVESYQKQGIYLSIMGFGWGNYKDSRMENISNHGNGTYNYIDCEDEMMKVFVHERSRFYSVANDTKCQVRFNPEAVKRYRLIGYENRVMSNEEFEDSAKDAGEIGAGQTITALYEIECENAELSPCTFEARYKFSLKDAESRSLTLEVPAGNSDSANMAFATGVTAYGLVLLDSEYKGTASVDMAEEYVKKGLSFDPGGYREGLLELIAKAKKRIR